MAATQNYALDACPTADMSAAATNGLQSRPALYLSTVGQMRAYLKDVRKGGRASFYLRVTGVGETRFLKIGRGQFERLVRHQPDSARAVATYTPDSHAVWIGGEP